MSHPPSLTERLSRALANPSRGVLGLVDELLAVSLENRLQLAWRAGHCHVRFVGDGSVGRIDVPVPQSVIRAALARIAALCNERTPNSVSPYGGMGELTAESDPAGTIRVIFVNTPEQQSLEIASVKLGAISQGGEHPLVIGATEDCPR